MSHEADEQAELGMGFEAVVPERGWSVEEINDLNEADDEMAVELIRQHDAVVDVPAAVRMAVAAAQRLWEVEVAARGPQSQGEGKEAAEAVVEAPLHYYSVVAEDGAE